MNVIGNSAGHDPREALAEGLGDDAGAKIHLYGKESLPNRKIGHVTVCDSTVESAVERAWSVVAALGGDVPEEATA